MMDELKYHIMLDGVVIAKFKEVGDRDDCLMDMQDRYEDCDIVGFDDE